MADITVTPVSAVPSTSSPQAVHADNAAASATQSPVLPLPSLPSGTVLQGFVLNRDPSGNPILRTDQGDFMIQSPYFLKIGSDVTVRLSGTGANAHAALVTVDGLPPEEAALVPAHENISDVVASPQQRAGTAAQAAAVQTGRPTVPTLTTLEGTVIRAATPEAAITTRATNTSAPAAPLPSGTQLRLQVISVTPAAENTAQPANTSAPQTASTGAASAAGAAAARSGAGNTPVQTLTAQAPITAAAPATPGATPSPTTPVVSAGAGAQQPAAVQVTAQGTPVAAAPAANTPPASPVTPQATQQYDSYARQQAQPTAFAASTAPAPTSTLAAPLDATVLHSAPTGETVLASELGDVQVHLPTTLPTGSQLSLQLLATQLPEELAVQTPLPAGTLPALATQWDTLDMLFQQLAELSPEDAQQTLSSLPGAASAAQNAQPGQGMQNLSSGVAFFISALTGGDIRSLLGQRNVQRLEDAGHGALVQKAQTEFDAMRTAFLEPQPQTWQALFVPVATDEGMRMVRFYTRRERSKGEQQQQRRNTVYGDTRFVVEADLSQLGEIQLDGFVKQRDEGGPLFDLVVRTHGAFSEEEKNDIRALFQTAGDATGYTGTLMFQEMPEFPVHPLEEIQASKRAEVTA